MGQKTAQELAKEYLALLEKARSWKQRMAVLAAHTAKHIRFVTSRRDTLKEALKTYGR